jgi:hypothetical protein
MINSIQRICSPIGDATHRENNRPLALFLDLLAVAGIMLDWLPNVIMPNLPSVLSGTCLLSLPAVVVSLIMFPRRKQLDRYGVAFAFALGIGLLSFLFEPTQFRYYFGRYGINSLFFLFFLLPRSPFEHRRILQTALVLTAVIPVVQHLGSLGIVTPYMDRRQFGETRSFTGVSPSDLGLLLAVIPATLGGICLEAKAEGRARFWWIFAGIIYVSGLYAIGLAGQRSASIAYVFCSVVALWGLLRQSARSPISLPLIILIAGVIVSFFCLSLEMETFRLLSERFRTIQNDTSALSRVGMIEAIIADMTDKPHLLGPGIDRFIDIYGFEPHIIFGEFYYVGGWVLFLTGVAGLGVFLMRWRRAAVIRMNEASSILWWIYSSLSIGLLLHCLTHTSFGVRALPMFFGLCMSAMNSLRSEVQPQYSRPLTAPCLEQTPIRS